MNREEQISKEAYRQSQVVTDVAENGSLYVTRLTEFEQGFKAGAKWADAHQFTRPVEERCSKERIEQIRNLYEKAYQSVAITLIEEGHSKESIARMFFELGFRVADEYTDK